MDYPYVLTTQVLSEWVFDLDQKDVLVSSLISELSKLESRMEPPSGGPDSPQFPALRLVLSASNITSANLSSPIFANSSSPQEEWD